MKDIDWASLGFEYTATDAFVRCDFSHGCWGALHVVQDKELTLPVSAAVFQYAQSAFEGVKAVRGVDDKVRLFRVGDHARRLQQSAKGLCMPPLPDGVFEEAVRLTLQNNRDYVPPYGSNSVLYLRPMLFGSAPQLGVRPSDEYTFIVYCSPIGPYYRNGFSCHECVIVRDVDRVAPNGTGHLKVGANYAPSFRATVLAHAKGYDCIFLDAQEHKYINECSAANFFGIHGNKYITPKSNAILPSITNQSLMTLAAAMGMQVEQRCVAVEELADFDEAAACGTATIISPISKIYDPSGATYVFGDGTPGPICTKLYRQLTDIQHGRAQDIYGWCEEI